jgi:hypothetical protein
VTRYRFRVPSFVPRKDFQSNLGTNSGYSVHAATAVKAHERERLEKLVRYMARPAIADDRIQLVSQSELRLRLKTPWKDGTHSLQLSPTELIEKLVALVPPRGFHLTRYFGVLAPGSKHRAHLQNMPAEPAAAEEQSSKPLGKGKPGSKGRKRMSWAALLRRTFQIDVFQCFNCGGKMKLVEVVESAIVITQTLTALGLSPRAPPIAPPRETTDLFQRPEEGFSEFGI